MIVDYQKRIVSFLLISSYFPLEFPVLVWLSYNPKTPSSSRSSSMKAMGAVRFSLNWFMSIDVEVGTLYAWRKDRWLKLRAFPFQVRKTTLFQVHSKDSEGIKVLFASEIYPICDNCKSSWCS